MRILDLFQVQMLATSAFLLANRAPIIELSLNHGQMIETALELYALDNGRFPTEEEGLKALLLPLPTTKRPPVHSYLGAVPDGWLKDGWGMPVSYSLKNGNPSLMSAGPDMEFGTDDDLRLSTPTPTVESKRMGSDARPPSTLVAPLQPSQ